MAERKHEKLAGQLPDSENFIMLFLLILVQYIRRIIIILLLSALKYEREREREIDRGKLEREKN